METLANPTVFSFFRAKWFCFLLCIIIPRVKSQSGLLCISECATCPMICSSPPPLQVLSEPPPPPPPPSPSLPPPLPPSSYISRGDNGGGAPATQMPAAGELGKINYSYPYFYYYASNGDSLQPCTIIVFLIMSMFSIYS